MVRNTDEIEIDFTALLGTLLQKSWIMGLCAVVCAGAVLLWSCLLASPQYGSTALFYVDNGAGSGLTNADITASQNLADSCAVILKTGAMLEQLASDSGVERGSAELDRMISVAAVEDTVFLEVTVTASTAEEAFRIAQAVEDVFPQRIASVFEGVRLRVVDPPVLASQASGPDHVKNAAMAFVAGLALSTVGITICYVASDLRKRV